MWNLQLLQTSHGAHIFCSWMWLLENVNTTSPLDESQLPGVSCNTSEVINTILFHLLLLFTWCCCWIIGAIHCNSVAKGNTSRTTFLLLHQDLSQLTSQVTRHVMLLFLFFLFLYPMEISGNQLISHRHTEGQQNASGECRTHHVPFCQNCCVIHIPEPAHDQELRSDNGHQRSALNSWTHSWILHPYLDTSEQLTVRGLCLSRTRLFQCVNFSCCCVANCSGPSHSFVTTALQAVYYDQHCVWVCVICDITTA